MLGNTGMSEVIVNGSFVFGFDHDAASIAAARLFGRLAEKGYRFR